MNTTLVLLLSIQLQPLGARSDIAVSLLTREARDNAAIDAAVVRQSKGAALEHITF